ncbi:MAG: MoxR family ATPase, partial [Actinobacteria bacterium]|nr:MoxR family ATPase [Actinomycetota bacterium]
MPSEVANALSQHGYLPDEGLATAIFLALSLKRPLLLEGEAGVGKTEVAKVLS